jgi:putative ABC transport system permease protein
MKLFYTIRTAARAIKANRVRSALTVLGIVIGITAIMLIVSIGEGAERLILGQIEGLGAETIILRPGREPTGPSDISQTLFADSIKEREIDALRRKDNVPALVSMTPVVMVNDPISYAGEVVRPTIFGWSAEFMLSMMNAKVEHGTIFDEVDIKQNATVAVVGGKTAEDLFGNDDPIGRSVRIRDTSFRVVAVLEKGGNGLESR